MVMVLLTHGQQPKQSLRLIRTSVGNQFMATYIGSLGRCDCYKIKDATDGKICYVATVGRGEFGPLCHDRFVAAMRARNVFRHGR